MAIAVYFAGLDSMLADWRSMPTRLDRHTCSGRHVAADPGGFLKAYETLAASVPADQRPLVEQLGPLTRKAVVAGQRGVFISDKAVQAWLLTLPKAELEGWVVAQQTLAPKLKATCAAA